MTETGSAPPPPPPAAEPGDEGLLLPDGSTVGGRPEPEPAPTTRDEPHFSARAVMARMPVRRITRVQAIALAVFSLVALGPVLAFWVVVRTDTSALPIVVAEDQISAEDGLILTMTITSVNAVTREMGVRMAIRSSSTGPDGLIEGGRMTETVNLGLPAEGSIQGSSTITLEKGSTVGAVEFVAPLEDGTIARYPYDTYAAEIVVIASREGDGELGPTSSANPDGEGAGESVGGPGPGNGSGATTTTAPRGSTGGDNQGTDGPEAEPTSRILVPISVIVAADVPGFVISGEAPADQSPSTSTIDLGVRRNGPTLLYVTWIMLLWWALSVSAVLLVWAAAIWRSTPPPWAYGYLVGVLFALAPLRGALPGQPPYGVLIDYVSFYWAVGTMGLGLLLLLSFFLRDARLEGRTRTRAEEQVHDRTADAAYDTGEVPVVEAVAPAPTVAPLGVPLGAEPVVEDPEQQRDRPPAG